MMLSGRPVRSRRLLLACQFTPSARALAMALVISSRYFEGNRTVALVGSSGVGKSTLTNRLLGRAAQATQEVRAHDGRGRHTTTHRQLFTRPQGGAIIDTPGIRGLELWNAAEGARAISMISRPWQPSVGFAIADMTVSRDAPCALPSSGEISMLSRAMSFVKLARTLQRSVR